MPAIIGFKSYGHYIGELGLSWPMVKRFSKSGKTEQIITLTPTPAGLRDCKNLGIECTPLKLRLVRVMLETGESEILCTSLLHNESFPNEIFGDLYHKRWPVEEDYKIMKCRMDIEAFTGKSVLSVYQDFYAGVFAKNLVAMLTFSVEADLETAGVKEKHAHQVNFTHAIGKAKDLIVLLSDVTCTDIASRG